MSTLLPDSINIVLVYSPAPRAVREVCMTVPAGTTLAQAVALWLVTDTSDDLATLAIARRFGIWGKAAKPGQVLEENDRIELYRILTVDPKTARRQRFMRQGSKGAGLFATRRVGGKAGY
jgi:uncharacterized protein